MMIKHFSFIHSVFNFFEIGCIKIYIEIISALLSQYKPKFLNALTNLYIIMFTF